MPVSSQVDGSPTRSPALQPIAAEVACADRVFPVHGFIRPGFEAVLQAFHENFQSGEEVGATASLWLDGECVVDLWGGFTDRGFTRPWREDTIVNAMSTTKAVAATCFHLLVDRGLADYDDPVDRYWPEFAAAGKSGVPIRYILDHRVGLPAIPARLWPDRLFDWQEMTSALAQEAPLWEPGAQAGYHVRTYGFLVGELVRRITGQTVGTFFRQNVAEPFGIDFQIGVPAADHARCAEFIAQRQGTIFDAKVDPGSLLARVAPAMDEDIYNSRRWRLAELPSSNGHGNARSLSRLYAILALGGTLDGKTLLSADVLARATSVQHELREVVFGRTYRQALGYLRNSPPIAPMGPNEAAFGHHGVGGSIGFADPTRGLAFAYVMNRMHNRLEVGPRAGRLVEAAYRCLAERS